MSCVASLALFAYLLTLVETEAAGRAYAAYGGIYVLVAVLWLWTTEILLLGEKTRHARRHRHIWQVMRFPVLSRRWLAWLLILAFSAGLSAPAFAGSVDNGHHTVAAAAAHGACLHAAAVDAEPQVSADYDASGALAAADCALAHLGQAVLDRPVLYAVGMTHCAYPPALADGSTGRAPGLEGDPPRPARTA